MHPDDLKFVQEHLDSAIKGIKPYNVDHRIIRKDGKEIWVHAQGQLLYDSSGEASVLLGTVIDITERKNLEETLLQTQHSLSVNTDMILWLGSDAKIQYANDAAAKITEYSHEELLNMTVLDLDPNLTKERWNGFWKTFREEGSTIFETTLKSKSGIIYDFWDRILH